MQAGSQGKTAALFPQFASSLEVHEAEQNTAHHTPLQRISVSCSGCSTNITWRAVGALLCMESCYEGAWGSCPQRNPLEYAK